MKQKILLLTITILALLFSFQKVVSVVYAQENEEENEIEQEDQFQEDYVPAPTPEPLPQSTPIVNQQQEQPITQPTNEPAPVVSTSEDQNQTNTNSTVIPTQQTSQTPKQTSLPWPWIITRAAGIASYLLLALLTITGITLTTGLLFRIMQPSTAWSIHRAIASVLLISVVTHIISILFDSFIKLRFVDVFIPFVSPFRPLLMALGIGGFYLLLLVLSTSLYTMTSHPRFWRILHYLGFPMFLMLFLHGVLIGTDAHQMWMQVIYWASGGLVALAVIYRLMWRYMPIALFRRLRNEFSQANVERNKQG
jgi:hypothetical protein